MNTALPIQRTEINFQVEPFDKLLDELKPLLQAHWDELPTLDFQYDLDPEYQQYYSMQQRDALRIVTARADGVLIGYIVVFLTKALHHRQINTAQIDILYITPEYRGQGIFRSLREDTEQYLKKQGFDFIQIEVNTNMDFSPSLEKAGYRCSSKVLIKRIE